MEIQNPFPPEFVKDLFDEFKLNQEQLKKALEEGLDAWKRVGQENQQDRENMKKAKEILKILRDYKRSKQKTVNDQVRDLIDWHKEFTGSGVSEAEAMKEIEWMFSRPSGRPQMSKDSPPIDLGALRYFALPLKELWEREGKSWTVTSNNADRELDQSPAERFLHQCVEQLESDEQLESHISRKSVRAIIKNPYLTNDMYSYDPDEQDLSEYFESVLINEKGVQYIKRSDTK
jgi:hypothetical protein